MTKRPEACKLCRFGLVSSGYCQDSGDPETAKLALVLDSPTSDDILDGSFISPYNNKQRAWEEKLLGPLGLKASDVLVAGAIRCRVPSGKFPEGPMRQIALMRCRDNDAALKSFRPNLAVVTYGFRDLAKTPATFRLISADLSKSYRFWQKGFRPVVLMGEEAASLVFPWMTGIKNWHGHWSEINGWI